jgi:hypothetical protein
MARPTDLRYPPQHQRSGQCNSYHGHMLAKGYRGHNADTASSSPVRSVAFSGRSSASHDALARLGVGSRGDLEVAPSAPTKADVNCSVAICITFDTSDYIVISERIIADLGPRSVIGIPRCEAACRTINAPFIPINACEIDGRVVIRGSRFPETESIYTLTPAMFAKLLQPSVLRMKTQCA